MDRENLKLEVSLREIRHLLSHLHGEVTALEASYGQILSVLRRFEGAVDLDDLTGLMRRGRFFEKWQALLSECQRLNESSGIVLIDIDHFKRINDTHGHPTGDEVLKRVAQLLKQFESPNCFSGRIGGEEFAVAIRGNDAEVFAIAEMIRKAAERLHGPVTDRNGNPRSGVEWKCTLSAGMASTRKDGFDATRLLKAADEALYAAKNGGRNKVCAA